MASQLRGLYIYWKIIGLCPFSLDKDEIMHFSYLGTSYTILITLAFSVCYVRAILNRIDFNHYRETSVTVFSSFSAISIEFFVVISSWLYFAFRQNQIKDVIKMLKKINETSRILGISQNFNEILKTVKMYIFYSNTVWLFLVLGDFLLLQKYGKFRLDVWISFCFPQVVSHNVIVIFINVMRVIEKFFYFLNESICHLSNKGTSISIIRERNPKHASFYDFQSFFIQNPLAAYGQMHSELVTLTKKIIEFFSILILLALGVHIIRMALNLHIICFFAKNRKYLSLREVEILILLCLWFLFHLIQTVALMFITDSTAREANRTGIAVHEMLALPNSNKYADSGQILSVRLLGRRLSINLCGVMEMKLSVMHKIIGILGTYLMIMIQIDAQNVLQKKIHDQIIKKMPTKPI